MNLCLHRISRYDCRHFDRLFGLGPSHGGRNHDWSDRGCCNGRRDRRWPRRGCPVRAKCCGPARLTTNAALNRDSGWKRFRYSNSIDLDLIDSWNHGCPECYCSGRCCWCCHCCCSCYCYLTLGFALGWSCCLRNFANFQTCYRRRCSHSLGQLNR